MAFVASRNASARRARCQQVYIANTSPPTVYGAKRRCSSGPLKLPAANCCWRWKRPRTSRGRPHANPSVLVCLSPSAEEEEEEAVTAASSSTSFVCGEEGYCASSYALIMPSPCEATSFVKTEPLQHLAIIKKERTESCDDDDSALRQVPVIFPAMEHLIVSCTTTQISSNSEHLSFSGRTHIFTAPSWPDSPLDRSLTAQEISSEQLCSSFTEELSGDDQVEQLNWHEDLHEGSCEFLSERFYHIEEDLKCIMGESRHEQQSCHETVGEQCRSKSQTSTLECANCQQGIQIAAPTESSTTLKRAQIVQKMEDFGTHGKQQVVLKEEPCSDCSALSSSLSEEEYRIDLVDFEPLTEEPGIGEEQLQEASLASAHRDTLESSDEDDTTPCQFKLALSLNYEAVLSAWRGRGSPFVDDAATDAGMGAFHHSLCRPDDHTPLNLQPGNVNDVSSRPEELVLPEASRMLLVCPANDGTCVGDDAGQMEMGTSAGLLAPTTSRSSTSTAKQRHARVLRYREKRRTRLFSKTIRYEVRKLNAERRPRMKGRFIKRSTD